MNSMTRVRRSIITHLIALISFALLTQADEFSSASLQSENISDSKAIVTIASQVIELRNNLIKTKADLLERFNTLENFTNDIQKSMFRLKKESRFDIIAQSIRSGHFSWAEQLLQHSDDIRYEEVSEVVYNHSESNIDLLQNYGDYLSYPEKKYRVFEDLLYQMTINKQLDLLKAINLHYSMKKDVIGHMPSTSDAHTVINILKNDIEKHSIIIISESFLNDSSWENMHTLSYYLFTKFNESVPNIYANVVSGLLDQMSPHKILNEAKKINHVESEQLIVQQVFHLLENGKIISTDDSIPLAHTMEQIIYQLDVAKSPLKLLTSMENVKKKLPESVKNLVFPAEICIQNQLNSEFLYAAKSGQEGYGSDVERRSVYTARVPEGKPKSPEFKWTVRFIDDYTFQLYNTEFQEKLFACNYNTYNNEIEKRLVYTYPGYATLVGRRGGSILAWNAEVDGAGLLIKNHDTKEYLFADPDKTQGNDKRYVFTYTLGGRTQGSHWIIMDCSDF